MALVRSALPAVSGVARARVACVEGVLTGAAGLGAVAHAKAAQNPRRPVRFDAVVIGALAGHFSDLPGPGHDRRRINRTSESSSPEVPPRDGDRRQSTGFHRGGPGCPTWKLPGPSSHRPEVGHEMLSIGKLAAGQADYYLGQADGTVTRAGAVSSGVEDYYLRGGEAAGRCAPVRGLRGVVVDEALRRVLDMAMSSPSWPRRRRSVRRADPTRPRGDPAHFRPTSLKREGNHSGPRNRKPRRSGECGEMGDPGLEPGTSSLSEKRSNRLS